MLACHKYQLCGLPSRHHLQCVRQQHARHAAFNTATGDHLRLTHCSCCSKAAAELSVQTAPSTKRVVQGLTPEALRQYISSNNVLSELLGVDSELEIQELFDGVINTVYVVHSASGASVIIKQALPYVRALGESFPLSMVRQETEAAAMQLMQRCCPAHVPQFLLYDVERNLLAMEYLKPPHQKLLYAIRQGQMLPGLAQQLVELMAPYLAHTSTALLSPDEAAATIEHFANCDIVAANEKVVLIAPFTPEDSSNRWTSPQLDADVQALWADPVISSTAAGLLKLYRTQKEALIHNDLHAGNLLVAGDSLYLIDWEFATYGPIAFDIGCLLGNLALAVLALQGMEQFERQQEQLRLEQQHLSQLDEQEQQRQQLPSRHNSSSLQQQQQQQQQQEQEQEQPVWRTVNRPTGLCKQQAQRLLEVMVEFWHGFMQLYPAKLAAATAAAARSDATLQQQQQQQQYWQQLLADSCGYAGCCLIRLTVGLHHYPDIQAINEDSIRVDVEQRCIWLGRQLLYWQAQHGSSSCSSGRSIKQGQAAASRAYGACQHSSYSNHKGGSCSSISGSSGSMKSSSSSAAGEMSQVPSIAGRECADGCTSTQAGNMQGLAAAPSSIEHVAMLVKHATNGWMQA